jgi:hypothetical protein
MATKGCRDCHGQAVLVKGKHVFDRCEDCRRAHTIKLWRVRKVARSLKEQIGLLIAYNKGDGWRAAYLLGMGPTHATVQPIGAIGGEAPDVMRVSIADIRPEEFQSIKYPRVEDYMAMTTTKRAPVLVVQTAGARDYSKVIIHGSEPLQTLDGTLVQEIPVSTEREQPKIVDTEKAPRKSKHAPIDFVEASRLYQSGMRMSAVVEAVRGTRAAGGAANDVRNYLKATGVYREPVAK